MTLWTYYVNQILIPEISGNKLNKNGCLSLKMRALKNVTTFSPPMSISKICLSGICATKEYFDTTIKHRDTLNDIRFWYHHEIKCYLLQTVEEALFNSILREAPFWNVLFPYGRMHCPKGGGGVKACQDGLEHFFPMFAQGVKGLARMFWSTFFPQI